MIREESTDTSLLSRPVKCTGLHSLSGNVGVTVTPTHSEPHVCPTECHWLWREETGGRNRGALVKHLVSECGFFSVFRLQCFIPLTDSPITQHGMHQQNSSACAVVRVRARTCGRANGLRNVYRLKCYRSLSLTHKARKGGEISISLPIDHSVFPFIQYNTPAVNTSTG